MSQLSRRAVLRGAVALGVLPFAGCAVARSTNLVPADPFTLGVASGDPAPDGVVIWTRLAPDPLADDGFGGMPARPVDVEWEVAADERFTRVEQRGIATATPDAAHSVHVDLQGLRPGAEYFYRFRAAGYLSPTGRTRTAPPPDALATALTMCVASCSHYEQGWFTAYRRLAGEQPDLVVHLGDYQYEYEARPGGVRRHAGPETVTLANYRQRYAQYKTDPDLQAAHAVAPWLAVYDDHELDNNWADETPEKPQAEFLARRAAAMRAYYENMPLRRFSQPRGVDMQLYRRIGWGALATFHLLDTRQYRTDQPCRDEYRTDCAERFNPFATLTGAEQERWLLDGFQRSRARWDVLGQQVFLSQVELTPGPGLGVNPDAWDGYPANRDRIVAGLRAPAVRNAVVLTGDVHSHWAAEVHERPGDVSSPVVATELVTTSISSGGDGSDSRADVDAVLPENPHIRYFNNRRGYVRARVTADEMRVDFRVLPYVSRPGAPVRTGASFAVPDRAAALNRL
ncbi:alkaline phosphatase D family protein [Mycolicibacterium arseniciresistens]|uniref:Alkaline phosphatase D family protein n=1 Tax=Mycolicibacterium arseniciresistens TaxID=3062257 RepID=A0ABT8UJK3_9MYCO|nr:alkaline phosphatase D family protein [Mycolicibacterium arseniciresistens]MDO3637346.1 alkaline phosphatase D family protein [Mycolicibacterium arseniciresistens]